MTREEAIELLEDLDGAIEDNHGRDYDEAFRMAIEALQAEETPTLSEKHQLSQETSTNTPTNTSTGLISRAEAIEAMQKEMSDWQYDYNVPIDKCIKAIEALPSADAVSEDTQTEERARFVAKETELAHIEAKLENAEKRLQGACTANFVAEQLDRLREMTDEERWDFFIRFFSPSAEAEDRPHNEWIEYTDCEGKTRTITCSKCGWVEHSWVDLNYCPNCGARMKGGEV